MLVHENIVIIHGTRFTVLFSKRDKYAGVPENSIPPYTRQEYIFSREGNMSAPVCFPDCFQVLRERVTVKLANGFICPADCFIKTDLHPLSGYHAVCKIREDVFISYSAPEDPFLGLFSPVRFMAKELPLKEVPDQGAAAVSIHHAERISGRGLSPEPAGPDIQVEEKRITEVFPDRCPFGRYFPSSLLQVFQDGILF